MISAPRTELPRGTLGKSGLAPTRLGFGAGAIGNLYRAVAEEETRIVVGAALNAGMRFFDTAPYYGFGLSEARLGAALAAQDPHGETIISTKVGRLLLTDPAADTDAMREGFVSPMPFRAVFDYSYDGVMRSFEGSRARLGYRRIDLLLAHDLGQAMHGADHNAHFAAFAHGGYRAMRELRDEGIVQAIGLGVNEWQVCEAALEIGDFDCFLLAGRYTLLEQGALDTFLPRCTAEGISVIIGGPYNSGILATGVKGPGPFMYDYAPASPAIMARVERLETVCDRHGVPLAAAALQFPLAHPQVAAVIPGLADADAVLEATRLFNFDISPELWDELRHEGLLDPVAPVPAKAPP